MLALLHATRGRVAQRGTPVIKPSLSGLSILIVDGRSLSAADISNRLTSLGARVHVVPNAASAVLLTRTKRLDVAMIGHCPEDVSLALEQTLDECGVPYILRATSGGHDQFDFEQVFSVALQAAA